MSKKPLTKNANLEITGKDELRWTVQENLESNVCPYCGHDGVVTNQAGRRHCTTKGCYVTSSWGGFASSSWERLYATDDRVAINLMTQLYPNGKAVLTFLDGKWQANIGGLQCQPVDTIAEAVCIGLLEAKGYKVKYFLPTMDEHHA